MTDVVFCPVRMSTPGHSTSGAEGVGDADCVTPGFALEKRLANRLPSDGALSMMLDAPEQPDSATAPTSATTARAGASVMQSLVFGVSIHDPLTFALAGGVVFLVALIASLTPAIRIARLNPIRALRTVQ